MSKKASKPAAFAKDPAMEILDAASDEAWEAATTLPSLLEGQEDNVTVNEATELAKIEQDMLSKTLEDLIDLFTHAVNVVENKVSLMDALENAPEASVKNVDAIKERRQQMKDLHKKVMRCETDFLHPKKPVADEDKATESEPKRMEIEYSSISVTSSTLSITSQRTVSTMPFSASRPELSRPTMSSNLGLHLLAEQEAQQSARKQIRLNMTEKHHFTPIEEIDTKNVMKNVATSGGSNLDGSYIETGVTFEEITRGATLSPGRKIAPPNFDETGIDDFNENVLPSPMSKMVSATPSDSFPPAFQCPPSRLATLGQIPRTPIEPRPSNIFPSRPVLSSSIGLQHNKK